MTENDLIMYSFRVVVTLNNKSKRTEIHKVREADTRFGSCVATGKVVRYYNDLRDKGKILDYHIYF